MSISEGLTNALAFGNREGAAFDLIIVDFISYSTLINELGAKVQYVQLEHDEVEVAFEAIHFHSALNIQAHFKSSLIDLEARQGDRAQAQAA